MENFQYYNPTRIIFGKGTISKIGKVASAYGKKALLVYGKGSIKRNGVYNTIIESLKKNGIEFVEHSDVKPNPVLSHTIEGIKKFKNEKCEIIIAAGGGSVIDEAKTISAGVFYDGDVWDFFIDKAKIEKSIPLFVVLTIGATGSEANSGAVITNEKTRQKYSIHSPLLFPKVSIIDPDVSFSLPFEQIAYGCVDAMLHLSEGYFTTKDRDAFITDNYVYAVIKTLIKMTERIKKNPEDYNARASFMWATTLALNGLQATGYKKIEFINHIIEHSLSALYDIPHGLGLAIIFPAFLKFEILRNNYQRIVEFGNEIFNMQLDMKKEEAEKVVKRIEEYFREIGIKTRLCENGIFEKDFQNIIENAMGLGKLWKFSYTQKDILKILELAK